MEFEWDENKRLANISKHGIDFVLAATMFDGRPFIDLRSPNPEELRFPRVAMLNDLFFTVV